MRRLFKNANINDSVNKSINDRDDPATVDLLSPLKSMPPQIAKPTVKQKNVQGSFSVIQFSDLVGCEETWDSELEESKDSKEKMHLNIPVAISTLKDGPAPSPGLQLFVKYNVSSPFLMLPLSQDEENARMYPAAKSDLFRFTRKPVYDRRGKLIGGQSILGLLSINELKSFLGQIVLGIEALHLNGLAHRDIKLGNILVTERNGQYPAGIAVVYHLQICDFDSVISVEEDSEISLSGSKEYLSPEVWEFAKKYIIDNSFIPIEAEYSVYKNFDHKANDCYALGIVFTELLKVAQGFPENQLHLINKIHFGLHNKAIHSTILSDLSLLSSTIIDETLLLLIDLIIKLIDENPKTRATIKTVKEHPFFQTTPSFFEKLKSKFGYRYINGIRHTSCPEKGDNSAILPIPLSNLYLKVKNLENQLNYLLNCRLEIQKNVNEQFLECWLDYETSKECTFKNAEQILAEIKETIDLPLINKNDVYKNNLYQLQKRLISETKRDLFKHIKCPNRKKVYDHITSFLNAKEKLYFKPKISVQNLSDFDYLKQWLEFREEKQDKQEVLEKAKLALQSINQAIAITPRNEKYHQELTAIKSVITSQMETDDSCKEILEKIQLSIKEQIQPQDSKSQDSTQTIKNTCQLMAYALTLPAIYNDKKRYAELIMIKRRLAKLNTHFNTIFDEKYEDQQTANAIDYMQAISGAYDSSLSIQNIVNEAYQEYTHRSNPDNKQIFCNRMELTLFHWGKNRIASEFKNEIDNLVSTQLTPELPMQLLDKVYDFLENGKGNNRTFSFKTILRNKLSRVKAGLKFNEKVSEEASISVSNL